MQEATQRLFELARYQHGVVSRRQAAAVGVTPSMLRATIHAGVLTAPVPGVLVVAGAPPTWRQQLMTATVAGSGRAIVSHRAAAALHGFDGAHFRGVEVTVPRGVRLPWLVHVTVHQTTRFDDADRAVVDGIPVTTVARTLADLGLVAAPLTVEDGLDGSLRRGTNPRWIDETLARVRRPGPTGTGVLSRVLDRRGAEEAIPESVFERRLLRVLGCGDLPQPVPQHEIRTPDGTFVARVDIAYPPWRVAVEAHSRRHHDGWSKVAADLERDGRLAATGWERLYVRWPELRAPERLRERVRSVLRQRGWPGRTGRWTT